jgi:hypothetical protein
MMFWTFASASCLFMVAIGVALLKRTATAGFYDGRRIRRARAELAARRAERDEVDRVLAGIDTAETRAALTAVVADLVAVTAELRAELNRCHNQQPRSHHN